MDFKQKLLVGRSSILDASAQKIGLEVAGNDPQVFIARAGNGTTDAGLYELAPRIARANWRVFHLDQVPMRTLIVLRGIREITGAPGVYTIAYDRERQLVAQVAGDELRRVIKELSFARDAERATRLIQALLRQAQKMPTFEVFNADGESLGILRAWDAEDALEQASTAGHGRQDEMTAAELVPGPVSEFSIDL
ncbi:MAG: hypothetical protein ACYDHM_05770 [Acidiferrobacterales bacterium]